MILVIGNKNYSSWSLRPWLVLKVLGLPFEEKRIALYVPGAKEAILQHSAAGKVPILIDGPLTVWDSLGSSSTWLKCGRNSGRRSAQTGRARSLCAEMHAGFAQLRTHMSMNVRGRYPGKGRTVQVLAEIGRIQQIWSAARGPFLFGAFSATDGMFAPVALRFRTYAVEVSNRAYFDAMLALPAMQEWIAAAEREPEAIPEFDLYE